MLNIKNQEDRKKWQSSPWKHESAMSACESPFLLCDRVCERCGWRA